jgi:hypothetical protein
MSNTVLVIGQSGSGKSSSIRNLDSKSTFIINVLNKPLPFRGYKNNYKNVKGSEDVEGNYFSSDNWKKIVDCVMWVDKKRPDIKTIVIDDWQYILSHEFLRRTSEKSYDKFSDIANHGWSTINACLSTRNDLTSFVLSHSEVDNSGFSKCKTIGKFLEDKITLEGMFTGVLHSRVIDGEYLFQTRADSEYLAKTPMGMFDQPFIPNDLETIKKTFEQYYNDDEGE